MRLERIEQDSGSTGIGECPCCESGDFRIFREPLMQCRGCGLVVDPEVWKPGLDETMETEWFEGERDSPDSSWVRWFERRNNERTLKRITPLWSGNESRLLEIGVGSGSFLECARRLGFRVTGCDLSRSICKHAERTYRIAVHHGQVHTLPAERVFDIVVMNHVLEHVSDPVDLLREVRRRMSHGAILHVAVPNIGSWESRLRGWVGYEPYHLVYFSPATLRKAAERAGFLVSRVSTHESFSGWFLAILRTFLRTYRLEASRRMSMRRRRSDTLGEHMYRMAMIVSGAVSWPLRKLQARLGGGDEAILIALAP